MNVHEVISALDPKMKEYKNSIQEAARIDSEKLKNQVNEINEDLAKKGHTLEEIKSVVDQLRSKAGRTGLTVEIENELQSVIAKTIRDNGESLAAYKGKGSKLDFDAKLNFKDAGTMTAAANLTGNVVAQYSAQPSLRGRRRVHFRDIPGVQVVNSSTGIWKYYLNTSGVGEGSFGNQTPGQSKQALDYDFSEQTITCNTLAGYTRIARQMMRDLPFLTSFLPGELTEDYYRAEDNSFINTLMSYTNSYSFSASVLAEKFIEGLGVILGRDYDPTAIVTTAGNWSTLLSTKPSNYSLPGDAAMAIDVNGNVTIAGVPIVVHNGMTSGKFFIGDFSRVKVIQADALSVRFAEEDADNITKNLVTVLVEASVALAVLRTDWGIYG